MNPKEGFDKALQLANDIMTAAKQSNGQVRVVETYGRFALQWLDRVAFDCELPKEPPQIVELGKSHKLFKLQTSTTLMACVSNKEDPAKIPLLRWSAEQARERKLFDSFDGETIRMPFDLLAGFVCECFLKILGLPGIRDYDVRLLTQMSIPKLWRIAQASDFACDGSGPENLRLMNLAEVATDMDGICVACPDVAVRELVLYVEDHMTKTNLKKDLVDKVKAEMLAVKAGTKQWNSSGSGTSTKILPST